MLWKSSQRAPAYRALSWQENEGGRISSFSILLPSFFCQFGRDKLTASLRTPITFTMVKERENEATALPERGCRTQLKVT